MSGFRRVPSYLCSRVLGCDNLLRALSSLRTLFDVRNVRNSIVNRNIGVQVVRSVHDNAYVRSLLNAGASLPGFTETLDRATLSALCADMAALQCAQTPASSSGGRVTTYACCPSGGRQARYASSDTDGDAGGTELFNNTVICALRLGEEIPAPAAIVVLDMVLSPALGTKTMISEIRNKRYKLLDVFLDQRHVACGTARFDRCDRIGAFPVPFLQSSVVAGLQRATESVGHALLRIPDPIGAVVVCIDSDPGPRWWERVASLVSRYTDKSCPVVVLHERCRGTEHDAACVRAFFETLV